MSDEAPQMQVQDLLEKLRARRRQCIAEMEELSAAIKLIERTVAENSTAESASDVSVSDARPSATVEFVSPRLTTSESVARGRVGAADLRPSRTWDEMPRGVPERASSVIRPKSLSGLTQFEALVQMARENGGIIRVADARDRFIRQGLTKSSPRNVYTNIHHQLRRSDQFEQVGTGEFRVVSLSPGAIGSAQPDDGSGAGV